MLRFRLDGADAWSIGRWGRAVGDEAAIMEEVIKRIQMVACKNLLTEKVPINEVIRPTLFESPVVFLRAYGRAQKVYEVVKGNEVVKEKEEKEKEKEGNRIEKGIDWEKERKKEKGNGSGYFGDVLSRKGSDNDNFQNGQCGFCEISTTEIRHSEVRKHLQKRLAGFVMREIQDAHSFIETFCGQDKHGSLWRKRWALRINNELIPLIQMMGSITTHKRLNQLCKTIITNTALEKGQFFVYARVNLRTNDLYIGETGNWTERFKQHFTAMHKHANGAINGCARCREHKKYKKHVRYIAPHEWMMVPIAHVEEKW